MKQNRYFYIAIFLILILAVTLFQWNPWTSVESEKQKGSQDDGSWVYSIEDHSISKKTFEDYYQFFLKSLMLETGVSSHQLALQSPISLKEKALEKLIEQDLIFLKAVENSFFKKDSGKRLLKSFYKKGLSQLYTYQKIFKNVNFNPSNKDLQDFEKEIQYKLPPEQRQVFKDKSLQFNKNSDNKTLKIYYTKFKISEYASKEQNRLTMEASIKKNEELLKKYLLKKISYEEIVKNQNEEFTLLKLNGSPIFLSDYVDYIDYQLQFDPQIKTFYKFLLDSNFKNDKKLEELTRIMIDKFKILELTYRKALSENYFKDPNNKSFVEIFQKQQVAIAFFVQNQMDKVTVKSQEINDFLKSKDNKNLIKNYLKNLGYSDSLLNSQMLKEGAQFFLQQKKLEANKMNFLKNLKESYSIRVSEKYFEKKSDKIQDEILKDRKKD